VELIRRYAAQNPRIRVFKSDNRGVSSARNIGLDNARGTYLAFVDSDDWVDARFLWSLMAEMTSRNADMAVCGYRFEPDSRIPKSQLESGATAPFLIGANQMHTFIDGPLFSMVWNKLYRGQILRSHRIRFPEHIDYGEDKIFNYRYLDAAARISFDETPVYHYRRRVGSLSSRIGGQRYRCHLEIAGIRRDFYRRRGMEISEQTWSYDENILDIVSRTVSEFHMDGSRCSVVVERIRSFRNHLDKYAWDRSLNCIWNSRRPVVDKVKLTMFRLELDRLSIVLHRLYRRRYRKSAGEPVGESAGYPWTLSEQSSRQAP